MKRLSNIFILLITAFMLIVLSLISFLFIAGAPATHGQETGPRPTLSLTSTPLPIPTARPLQPYQVVELETRTLSVRWIDPVHVLITWSGSGSLFRLSALQPNKEIYIDSGIRGDIRIPSAFRGSVDYQPMDGDQYRFKSWDNLTTITVALGKRPIAHVVYFPVMRGK